MGSHRFLRALFAALFALAIAGCGGGGASGGFGDDPTGPDPTDPTDPTDPVGPTPSSLILTLPDGNQLAADADTLAEGLTIEVVALDPNNNSLAAVPIRFSADTGQLTVQSGTTGANGRATAILTTAGNASPRPITITATATGASATTTVQVVPPTNNNVPQPRLGLVLGDGTFSPGVIGIGVSPVSAGGSSALRVDIADVANGNAEFVDPVSVTFLSPCISAGNATVTPNPAASANGAVSATYVASGCSGDDLITARAVINGTNQAASGTIEVLAADLGSIEFVSATPENIGLQGGGGTVTSTVKFRVKNTATGTISGQEVSFSLNTSVGGIALSPESGTTDDQGLVQTVVRAGTVATTVRVTATAVQGSTTVSSQSEQLTITTGIPDQNSFSLSAETLNAEGLNIDGTVVGVTIRAADRYNNPVPDNTAVNFTTEGGRIEGSCLTVGGECTVEWVSQNPRPSALGGTAAGRSTIFAHAVGEESFTDADGDGLFDNVNTDVENYVDLPEAFIDKDEDGLRDTDEEFVDFNNNGAYDGGDGQFNGLLCDTSAIPGGVPTPCPGSRTLNVRNSLVLVMSGSSPEYDPVTDVTVTGVGVTYDPSTLTIRLPSNGTASISVVVRDVNDQPMASGTDITYTVFGGGELLGSSSFVVPSMNNDSPGANTYGVTYKGPEIEAGDPDNSALVELSVTSPSGLETRLGFNVITEGP